jgi:hypothetical protein
MKMTANNEAELKKRPMLKIVVVATLLLSASLASGYWLLAPDGTKEASVANPVQPADERASALRTGVIIFQRLDGTDCGRKVIDNATGKVHGTAGDDCRHETASTGSSKPKYDPGARPDAVKSSFQPNKPAM